MAGARAARSPRSGATRRGGRGGQRGGAGRVRRSAGVPGAVCLPRAARRGAGAGRRGERDTPRRPGLLGAAAVSKARRGGAGAAARRDAAGRPASGGGRPRPAAEVPGPGHRRVPGRHRSERVLVPRGERAHPGGAPGDRGSHRARSGGGADRGRRGTRAPAGPGRCLPARPCDRVPHQRGGSGGRVPAEPGHRDQRGLPGRAGYPGRHAHPGGFGGTAAVRQPAGQAHRQRRHPDPGAGPAARRAGPVRDRRGGDHRGDARGAGRRRGVHRGRCRHRFSRRVAGAPNRSVRHEEDG